MTKPAYLESAIAVPDAAKNKMAAIIAIAAADLLNKLPMTGNDLAYTYTPVWFAEFQFWSRRHALAE